MVCNKCKREMKLCNSVPYTANRGLVRTLEGTWARVCDFYAYFWCNVCKYHASTPKS